MKGNGKLRLFLLIVGLSLGFTSLDAFADSHDRFTLTINVTNNETGQPLDDAEIIISGSGTVHEILEPPIVSIISPCRTGNLPITCETGGPDATQPGVIKLLVGPGNYSIRVGHEVFEGLSGNITLPHPDFGNDIIITAPLNPDPKLRERSLFVNILGRYVDANGNERIEPIEGAQFDVFSADGGFLGGGMIQLAINPSGETEWRSDKLVIGDEVRIVATAEGFITQEFRLTVGTGEGGGFTSQSDAVVFTLEQETNEVRQLIVEVLDAATNEPISNAAVNLQEIVGGASVASGRTGSDGRTDPLAISGNIDPTLGLRVEVSQLGYENALSDVPPSLLQPGEGPNIYTVFLRKKEVSGQCGVGKVCVFLVTNVDQLDYGDDASMEGGRRCNYQGGGLCGSEGGDTPIEFIVYMGPFDTQYEANKFYCDDQLEPEKGVRLTQMRIIKFGTDGQWHGVNHMRLPCPAVKPDPPADPPSDPGPQPPPIANQGDDYIEFNGKRIDLNKALRFSLSPGELQQMVLQCNLNGAFGLMSMGSDSERARDAILTSGALAIKTKDLSMLKDFCDKLAQSTSSGSAQASSFLSGDISLIPLQSIPGIEFEIEVEQGALVTSVSNNDVDVNISTPTTSVQAMGKTEVGVAYDPDSGTSTVSAYDGSVNVDPKNSSLPSIRLSEGEQVNVTQSDVGSVQPITGPDIDRLPKITGIGIPGQLKVGVPVEWPLSFTDGNGNINFIRFEQWADGQWMNAGEGNPNILGKTSGSLTITTECKKSQIVRARVTIADSDGNTAAKEYTYQCVTTSADPSPGRTSILTALDTNQSGFLDDAEIRKAFQYWIMGQPVPGTDQTIDDATMRKLVQIWILGTPVGEAASASMAALAQPMMVHSLAFSSPGPMQRTLNVAGQNIASVQLQVFDLNGRLQLQSHGTGSQLRFSLLNQASQPLANGVYLYVVTIQGMDGTTWRSGIRKMAVLR